MEDLAEETLILLVDDSPVSSDIEDRLRSAAEDDDSDEELSLTVIGENSFPDVHDYFDPLELPTLIFWNGKRQTRSVVGYDAILEWIEEKWDDAD